MTTTQRTPRKGQFILVEEGGAEEGSTIWRLARAWKCSVEGGIRRYRYVDDYANDKDYRRIGGGFTNPGASCIIYGPAHTDDLAHATRGMSLRDMTYATLDEAKDAVFDLLGIAWRELYDASDQGVTP